jgi:hypothetical protein
MAIFRIDNLVQSVPLEYCYINFITVFNPQALSAYYITVAYAYNTVLK